MNDEKRPALRLVAEGERPSAPPAAQKPRPKARGGRRTELTRVEVWRNPEHTLDPSEPYYVADAEPLDGPVYANQPEIAAALAAERWRLSTQYPQRAGAERYSYSVEWDADAGDFLATVAEFPGLEERAETQLAALLGLVYAVGTHLATARSSD